MKFSKFKAGLALSSALVLAALTGCGTANNTSPSNSTSASSSISGSDSSSSNEHTSFFVKDNGDGTKVIKDIDGTEVTVPTKPERIADLWHANNQVVLLLGGADKLVATTTNVKSLAWFKKIYPGIENIDAPVKGTDVNMEQLSADKPEVLLASNKDQVSKAAETGIPSVHVEFQNFTDLKRTVELTAEVIGTPEAIAKAKQYIAYLEKNEKLVQDRLKDVKDKPKVLHISGGSDLTKVDGSKSLIGEWMKLTGAENSLDGVENLKNVSLEQIIASNPDIIIIGGSDAQKGVDAIKSDPAWADVPAVKNNKILKNPVGTFNWDRYSAEEALQILWAAQQFHPEQFQDINLVKETQDFYKTYYGYDLTEEDANRILSGQGPVS
ncbi:ABC transporter substrate-binding protein [Rothia dentocariosa]|uniref:ABC transporter substrate-binding protein n=1 Tax=Rothia dentocariosa TaxID=2047 RepID=UPI001957853F|nr:ABC transporter substrate-binding protein [Rothia dentocariosa]VTY11607.1 Hemin-binding periplasmic protein HmuT [Rothia dentocariosa]